MQLKIPIISAMLLISDNFKHWPLFSRLRVLLRSLASSHLPMFVNLGLEQLQTETDLALGIERQQMLGISLNILERHNISFGA